MKILTYIITRITARSVGLAAILAIMSVSNFKAAVILYLISLRDIFSINRLTLVLKTIGQCDVISHYDVIDKKNNNVSFECLDKHYHYYHS